MTVNPRQSVSQKVRWSPRKDIWPLPLFPVFAQNLRDQGWLVDMTVSWLEDGVNVDAVGVGYVDWLPTVLMPVSLNSPPLYLKAFAGTWWSGVAGNLPSPSVSAGVNVGIYGGVFNGAGAPVTGWNVLYEALLRVNCLGAGDCYVDAWEVDTRAYPFGGSIVTQFINHQHRNAPGSVWQ